MPSSLHSFFSGFQRSILVVSRSIYHRDQQHLCFENSIMFCLVLGQISYSFIFWSFILCLFFFSFFCLFSFFIFLFSISYFLFLLFCRLLSVVCRLSFVDCFLDFLVSSFSHLLFAMARKCQNPGHRARECPRTPTEEAIFAMTKYVNALHPVCILFYL